MSRAAMKALSLVEVVARTGSHGVGAMEAAAAAGLDKTTASRLLRMLTEHGWLMRDPMTRRYLPGRVLVGIAQATGFSQETRALIDGVLGHLRERVVETVALHQRSGAQRVCVAGAESREEVRTGLLLGDTKSLALGASGKVILSFCDQLVREQVLAEPVAAQARDQVLEQLATVERHGYLSTTSAVTTGVGAVAVPVFDKIDIYGALTIAGPASRFDVARRRACVPLLFKAADQLTQILGGPTGRYAAWTALRTGQANGAGSDMPDDHPVEAVDTP